MALSLALLVSLILLAACGPGADSLTQATPTTENTTVTEVVVPYRPEAYSGAIAGIGEYGISFQYDPYLAAGIQPRLVDAFTDDGGMNYLLLPQHLSFTFPNSYADADPIYQQRWQLNLETMPQIVVYPAAAYSAMHPLARVQIEQLQTLLATRPSTPGGTMPYLPLNNAAQVFHSQVAYLSFANGAGLLPCQHGLAAGWRGAATWAAVGTITAMAWRGAAAARLPWWA